MKEIFALFSTAIICWLFIRWVLANKSERSTHNCEEYEMYFMDEISHGTYCGKCHKVLGEIVHSELQPSQDLPSTYYNGA
jgi:hypothetical protein